MTEPWTVEEYCENFGFSVSDFTPGELRIIEDEVRILNAGGDIEDSFLDESNIFIYIRKALKDY